MGILEELSNKAGSSQAADELKRMLLEAGAKPEELETVTINQTTGSATFEGREFTFDRGLRLIGYCQQCRMEVPSRVIRSISYIAPLLRTFRPDAHDCMDVD
jgi:hypothetical protein